VLADQIAKKKKVTGSIKAAIIFLVLSFIVRLTMR
jgi:hypothetical protein